MAPPAFKDLVRELRRVPAGTLRPHPLNWRTHPKAQAAALRGLLAEVGFASALLARELPDGSLELIDGHLRADVAADAMVPVLVVDVDEAGAAKLLATLDPLAAMAGADRGKLDDLLRGVQTGDEAIAALIEQTATAADLLPGVGEAELPDLPAGDREAFQQMTFTLADEQAATVKEAVAQAKAAGGDTSDVNANSNGNALARIAEAYLDRR